MKPIAWCALTVLVGVLLIPHESADAQSSSAPAGTAPQAACAAAGDLHFVCGLINVEDFLPVDGGRWLVGGSFQAGSAGLYLINTAEHTARPVALSIARVRDAQYAGCPAPDLKRLSTHGLDVVPGRAGSATVYAVNHGGRESVEVFRLDAARAAAQWIGCVLMPAGANGNAVAALPGGGGFVVTKFMETRDKQAFQHLMAGAVTGVVYRWTPGKGFSEVPGTRLAGDNGVVVSPDGKWVFVNAYGSDEIYRVALSGTAKPTSVKVAFHPDNLRWAPDGTLFDTGQFLEPGRASGPPRPDAWATVRLDPRTMAVTPLVKEPGRAEFADATSAVQIGDTLWFCTFRGTRVAYRDIGSSP
ncbi:MAG TPA: hypothetical protein VN660_03765 [Steroidobacteraceae bacterium]|nr:hypothetical protein [Steroidobacteraceae bacterium]